MSDTQPVPTPPIGKPSPLAAFNKFFLSAEGFILLFILYLAERHGFGMPHAFGMIGVLLLHHKDAILALLKTEEVKLPFDPQQLINAVNKTLVDVKTLQDSVARLNMAAAFRTGLKPGTEGEPKT